MQTYICLVVFFIEFIFIINSQKLLYEGDACELKNKEPGVCVRLSLCYSAREMIESNEYPITCGFVKNVPIICCSKKEVTAIHLAEEKCDLYSAPKISVILGEDAKPKEFPHMAALGYDKNNKKNWLCGGSLISDKFVLTAAHCLFSSEYGPVKFVRLGDIILQSSTDENNTDAQDYKVIRTIAHPLYSPPSVYNDVGLVELDQPITFSKFVKPACLFTKDVFPEGSNLIATGWGLTKVGGNQSNILQKVNLNLFTKEECDKTYEKLTSTRKLKKGILHHQQICAGGRDIGTDTCQGDSGGPLKIKKNDSFVDVYYIVGVTSFGKSCGFENVPGIYSRVSHYLSWIESQIWPNEM